MRIVVAILVLVMLLIVARALDILDISFTFLCNKLKATGVEPMQGADPYPFVTTAFYTIAIVLVLYIVFRIATAIRERVGG